MNLLILFGLIFVFSTIWSLWSLRDLKTPNNLYPKMQRRMQKLLMGVIHLPKAN